MIRNGDFGMINLQDENSIILGLGDLKLSDTEYTFREEKAINGIYYNPIFPSLAWEDENSRLLYELLLSRLVSGDGVAGVEILKGEDTFLYGFGANRLSSNASNIVLGFLEKDCSYFIKEFFDSSTIYTAKPELIERDIIRVSNWRIKRAEFESLPVLSSLSDGLQIDDEATIWWKFLEPRLLEFQDAFKEEQLNQLRIRRR